MQRIACSDELDSQDLFSNAPGYSHRDYFLDDREMFARAYVQLVAAGIPALSAAVNREEFLPSVSLSRRWSDEEFSELRPGLMELLSINQD